MSWFFKKRGKRLAIRKECLDAIEKQLDLVEAEMRRIGYWVTNPVDPQSAISGELKTFADAPTFELWLQYVFLPNARLAVVARDLPATSEVGLMAMRQYDYHSFVPEAQRLFSLLAQFDALVERYNRA